MQGCGVGELQVPGLRPARSGARLIVSRGVAMAHHAGGRRRAGVSRPRRLAGLWGAAQSDWVFGVGAVRRDAGQLRQGPARRRQGDLTIATTIARDSARLRRGRRPGSIPCTPEEREFRRCGWTWVGLPGGGAKGRSAAPECAPPRPATASCRRRAAEVLNVERWGDVPAKSRRKRLWRVPSLGTSAQTALGRPASARSRLGPPLGGDRSGGGPQRGTPGRAASGSAQGNGRRGVGGGCEARRRNANCRSRAAGGYDRKRGETRLRRKGSWRGGRARAFWWMRDRGSWIPSWTRRNAGRFRPLSESWR